jgi:Flp pilus assembly protein TadD
MHDTRHKKRSGWVWPKHRAAVLAFALVLGGCQATVPNVTPLQNADGLSHGMTLLRTARYSEAYTQFNALRPFDTRNPDALRGLAIAADMTGNHREASRAYEALANVEQDEAAFYNNRGYSRMLNGELQAAYSDLTRAAALDPENEKIRNNLRMLRAVLPRRGEF